MNCNSHFTFHRQPMRRRGVCVLELIVVIPIVMTFLLAVVLFGTLLSESNQVLQAANVGAQQASLQSRATASALLAAVVDAVDEQLASASFVVNDTNRQVIVEAATLDTSMATAGPGLFVPGDALSIPGDCVRVTVAVRLGVLSEDLLATYGYSIADGYAFHRVIKKYNGPST